MRRRNPERSFAQLGRVPRTGARVVVHTRNLKGVLEVTKTKGSHPIEVTDGRDNYWLVNLSDVYPFETPPPPGSPSWSPAELWEEFADARERAYRRGEKLNPSRRRRNPDADVTRAREIYEDTHWGEKATRVNRVPSSERSQPRIGTAMGRLRKVIYETTKGGEHALYDHDFESPYPMLVFGKPRGSRKNRLYIVGGGYDVDTHGIKR